MIMQLFQYKKIAGFEVYILITLCLPFHGSGYNIMEGPVNEIWPHFTMAIHKQVDYA